MTPRLVVICSFLVGCMIIAAGAMIGRKEHPSKPRDVPVATAADGVPANSAQPDATQPDTSQQTPLPPEGLPPALSQPTSTQAEKLPSEPNPQFSAPAEKQEQNQETLTQAQETQPSPAPEAVSPPSAKPGSVEPDSTQAVYAPSLPVMFTYEMKRNRETTSVIARDPKGFWIRQIVAKIEEKKADLPKSLDGPVAVQLEFVVGRNGALLSKSVSKSSGSVDADKTAIAMLERAQPFPPMPDGLQDQEMTFSLPVRFR